MPDTREPAAPSDPPALAAPWAEVNTPDGSALLCPVENCGKRFGPLNLLLDHLHQSMYGGHDMEVSALSVRVRYKPRVHKSGRQIGTRDDA